MTSAVLDSPEYQDNVFAGLSGHFRQTIRTRRINQATAEDRNQAKDEIDLPQAAKNTNLSKQPLNFEKTRAKTEEIQQEFEAIRNLWLQGYDRETKEVNDLESIITAIEDLERFIANYWDYFIPEDRRILERYANYIQQNLQPQGTGIVYLLKLFFSGRIIKVAKLFLQYRQQLFSPSMMNILTRARNINSSLPHTILRLVKEDKKKPFQETATIEERLRAFHEFSSLDRKHDFYLSDSAHKRENLYKDVN